MLPTCVHMSLQCLHLAPGCHSNSEWLSMEKAAGMCCVDEDKSPINLFGASPPFFLHTV